MNGNRGYWERFASGRLTRRRALAGAATLGAGAAALSLVGCGGGDGGAAKGKGTIDDPSAIIYTWQTPDTTAEAVPGGLHKAITSSNITGGFDIATTSSFTTLAVASVAYEELLMGNPGPGIDPNSAEGRKIQGRLAESFEVSGDAITYTFKVRPNVKFHNLAPVNGRAMDVDDWRTTLTRIMDVSPLLKGTLNELIDKLEYPDSRTMVVKLKAPNVGFLRILTGGSGSFYVMPKELNQDTERAGVQPIGTSARVLVKTLPGVGREYRAHADYWQGKPFMDGWVLPLVPEYANQYAQFVTGAIFSFTPRQTDVLQLRKDTASLAPQMLKGDPPGSYRVNFFGLKEFETAPWRDDRVRKAMRMAVDWDAVRAHFSGSDEFEAAGIPVESLTPTHVKSGGTGRPYWLDPKEGKLGGGLDKFFLFDLVEAKKLMTAAGHGNGIEIDVYMNGGTEYGTAVYPELVQIHVDQWAKSGLFKATIHRPPYSEFLPNYYRDRNFKGMVIEQPEFTYNEIGLELFNWYHSRGQRLKLPFPQGSGDPKVDEFIDKQFREADDNKRASLIAEFQRYMADKMYAFPGDGVSGGFGFRHQWYKNTAWQEHKHWIAPNAPNRSGGSL
jgi:peptide/nickel transport system substrate-binding protein